MDLLPTGQELWQQSTSLSKIGRRRSVTYIAGAYYCSRPVSHIDVITVVHAVANKSVTNTFLPFLKLF